MPVRASSTSPPTVSPAAVVAISAVSSIGNGLSPHRTHEGRRCRRPSLIRTLVSRQAVHVRRARQARSRGLDDRPGRHAGRIAIAVRAVRRGHRALDLVPAAERDVAVGTVGRELLAARDVGVGRGDDRRAVEAGRALRAGGTGRACGARRANRALLTLGTSRADRSGVALRTSRADRSGVALRACGARRPCEALSTGDSSLPLRAGRPAIALRACGTSRANRPGRANFALRSGETLLTGRAHWAGCAVETGQAGRPARPDFTLEPLLALGAGRTGIALRASRTGQ